MELKTLMSALSSTKRVVFCCLVIVSAGASPSYSQEQSGETCQADSDCLSGLCLPTHLENELACVADGLACALSGYDGSQVGDIVRAGGLQYECLSSSEWTLMGIENGQVCQSDTSCLSGYCGIGADGDQSFCFAASMNCARENHDGALFGDQLRVTSGQVECTSPTGWTPAELENGVQCFSDTSCNSGYCRLGPERNAMYCLAETHNCSREGHDGMMFGERLGVSDGRVLCVEGVGWARAEQPNGERCYTDGECSSGYCRLGPMGQHNYCLAANFHCGLEGEEGANRFRRVVAEDGLTYSCALSGVWVTPPEQRPGNRTNSNPLEGCSSFDNSGDPNDNRPQCD